MDAASSSDGGKLDSPVVVWYALSWPSNPLKLPGSEDEVRKRGHRVEIDKAMVDWEFKDWVRQQHKLSAPMLLYYLDDRRRCIWSMCHEIDGTINPLFLKVEVGDQMPADEIPKLEEQLEERQSFFDSCRREVYDMAAERPPQVQKFKVVYAVQMPSHKLELLESMRDSMTLTVLSFPIVPTVTDLKSRLHQTEAHRLWKSWPIKYRKGDNWLDFPLQELEDDVSLSDFGSDNRLNLLFNCPQDMIGFALPDHVPHVPWKAPPPDERY